MKAKKSNNQKCVSVNSPGVGALAFSSGGEGKDGVGDA